MTASSRNIAWRVMRTGPLSQVFLFLAPCLLGCDARISGRRQTPLTISPSHSAAAVATIPSPTRDDPASPSSPRQASSPGTSDAVPASQVASVSVQGQLPDATIDAGIRGATPMPGHCHVLAIGDSLTDPRSNGGGYLRPWSARCPQCRFTNIARGGAMVNQMLSQLRRHLLETDTQYSHWVVFGGVNDLYSDITANRKLPKIERDLSTIYAMGHQNDSLVIAITVAPWGGFHRYYTEQRGANTAELNRWMTTQQANGAIDFVVQSGAVLACGDSTRLCPSLSKPYHDGLHFGAEGHQQLGASLLAVLGRSACGD
jgi:hypothetical protein